MKFRPAAADVHKSATIPGGSILNNLATVVASSDIQEQDDCGADPGSEHLSAKPIAYEVRL